MDLGVNRKICMNFDDGFTVHTNLIMKDPYLFLLLLWDQ